MRTFAACLALLAIPLALGPVTAGEGDDEEALAPGQIAPMLKADGWLNGEAPTAKLVEGKVWVIDFFAHW
ncbi:MAG: hypothetical protein HYY18_10040 [Planctomycetes bacterium]|nr:hypothetical protein [Planctomycetota bacterium]